MSSYARKYSHIVKDLHNGHGWRLAAVIFYLRKQGWKIETILDSRRIGHYRLVAGWTPEMLESGAAATTPSHSGKDEQ